MTTIWILGDQLSHEHPSLAARAPGEARVLMVEARARGSVHRYHQIKLVLVYSAMRHFAAYLRAQGWEVDYRPPADGHDFASGLRAHVEAFGPDAALVSRDVRRCLRLGDGAQRPRHGAACRWRLHGHQAVCGHQRLYPQDEQLLRRLPLRSDGEDRRRRLPVQLPVLGLRRPPRGEVRDGTSRARRPYRMVCGFTKRSASRVSCSSIARSSSSVCCSNCAAWVCPRVIAKVRAVP